MTQFQLEALESAWRELKEAEDKARADRIECERQILELLGKPEEYEGTEKVGGLRVNYKINQRVDASELRALVESGTISSQRASELFRLKPEIIASAWKKASAEELATLSRAITTTPAKPGFRYVTTKETK